MNTNNDTIFCVWGAVAAATWRTRKLSRAATNFPAAFFATDLKLGRFPSPSSLTPRDFAFYVADPISSIHRSSRINWIRVDSCAFVVTTNLASDASSDSGRADQRDHLAFVPTVNAKILVGCDHTVVRIKLTHPDQTKIRQIGLPVGVA